MPTGNALIDRAALELNRADDLGSTGTNVAQSKAYLNDAIRHLVNRYDFSWRVAATPLAVSTVVNQTLYDASAGAGGVKIQDLAGIALDTGGVDTFPMEEISLIRYRALWANVAYAPSGKPKGYAKVGKYQFVVAPKPDSAAYTMQVSYWPEFVVITDFTLELTDPVVLPAAFFAPRAEEAVFLGLLTRMTYFTHEWQAAAQTAARAERELQGVITEDKDNPNLSYTMQGAVFSGQAPKTAYWANIAVKTQQ